MPWLPARSSWHYRGNFQSRNSPGYRDRQYRFLSAGVHLVEIDLIRGGSHVVSVPPEKLASRYPAGTCHLVCATRWLGGEDRR